MKISSRSKIKSRRLGRIGDSRVKLRRRRLSLK